MWNNDEIKGKGKEIKGKIKEEAGDLMDDPNLENRGRDEKAEGQIQNTYGEAKRKVKETVDDLLD